MTPFAIPTRDDIAPRLTQADRTEMFRRVLALCVNPADASEVFAMMCHHGLTVSDIGATEVDAAIDEEVANRGTVL